MSGTPKALSGWDATSRSLALGRLSRRGRVRLFALVTARAQHQQLCWHARGAVVRRRQVDRGMAAGPSAVKPEVVGATRWLQHRRGWDVDVGGALWQIGHEICPAFFEADLITKAGQEQWRQQLGPLPTTPHADGGFPASKLDSSAGRADAVRMELLRAAMRGCNILFQGMRSRGGCGRRLPNYEAYGLADEKDAEDFLTEVCDLLELSEEDVFDIWSVEASVRLSAAPPPPSPAPLASPRPVSPHPPPRRRSPGATSASSSTRSAVSASLSSTARSRPTAPSPPTPSSARARCESRQLAPSHQPPPTRQPLAHAGDAPRRPRLAEGAARRHRPPRVRTLLRRLALP